MTWSNSCSPYRVPYWPHLKRANPIALDHPLETLSPQPGDTGARTVHYALDVQPILDRHCVGCHGGENPKGELALNRERLSRSVKGIRYPGKGGD
jgi:hypothetical protein